MDKDSPLKIILCCHACFRLIEDNALIRGKRFYICRVPSLSFHLTLFVFSCSLLVLTPFVFIYSLFVLTHFVFIWLPLFSFTLLKFWLPLFSLTCPLSNNFADRQRRRLRDFCHNPADVSCCCSQHSVVPTVLNTTRSSCFPTRLLMTAATPSSSPL